VCLSNFVFNGVFGVEITAAKLASDAVKFCCDCVCVEDSVSEVKGLQLKRLLKDERRDAKFNHCDVCGEVKQFRVRYSEWMRVSSTTSICALVTRYQRFSVAKPRTQARLLDAEEDIRAGSDASVRG